MYWLIEDIVERCSRSNIKIYILPPEKRAFVSILYCATNRFLSLEINNSHFCFKEHIVSIRMFLSHICDIIILISVTGNNKKTPGFKNHF